MDQAGREAQMSAIYEEYAAQRQLAKIAEGRRLVPGYGMLDAPVVVVGEAPGEKEDEQGRPFVGPAGRLLQFQLSVAGIPWGYCYVTNTLPWRPPANRTPYPFEVQASRARVAAEVALIDPVVVIAAGSVAWSALTAGELGPFEDARFRWQELDGRRLLAIPHPSYLLHLRSAAEREVWEKATVAALSLALPQEQPA